MEVNLPCVVRNFALVHTSSVTLKGMHQRLIIGSVPLESNRHLKTNLCFTFPMRNPDARMHVWDFVFIIIVVWYVQDVRL
jgi:hypothetical protein